MSHYFLCAVICSNGSIQGLPRGSVRSSLLTISICDSSETCLSVDNLQSPFASPAGAGTTDEFWSMTDSFEGKSSENGFNDEFEDYLEGL